MAAFLGRVQRRSTGGIMALEFSNDARQKIAVLRGRYPDAQSVLIPLLHLAVKEFGYLSKEAMVLVATTLEMPETQVLNTATFYSMLRKKPVGKYHFQVCGNPACYLRGSDNLLAHLKEMTGIGPGETTPDGLFSIEEVQCLASCGTAPVMQVNEDYHEDMTIEKVSALVDACRKGGQVAGGKS